jgi:hypothetical protein
VAAAILFNRVAMIAEHDNTLFSFAADKKRGTR